MLFNKTSWLISDNINMRTDMKVVPLARLYEQRKDYEAHRRKLASIKSQTVAQTRERKSEDQRSALARMNLEIFQRKLFDDKVRLARANQRFVNRLDCVKGSLSFGADSQKNGNLAGSRSASTRTAEALRARENQRLKAKVQSMGSSLKRDSLLKDYERAAHIRNRLMRYRTEHNHKVVLKADKILSSNQHRSNIISARTHSKDRLPYVTPKIKTDPAIGRNSALLCSASHRRQQLISKMQLKGHKSRQLKERISNLEKFVKDRQNEATFCTEIK